MEVKAAAKLNLMLDVLDKLPNGYHSLFMVMQSVGLYDTVRLERTSGNEIKILSGDARVPTNNTNIAYRAAEAFFSHCGIENNRGIEIEIEKKIPIAAGLAGGSADGAAVLYMLNTLFDTALDTQTLCKIGEAVGADIPFALTGGTSLCLHTGGVIAPLPALNNCFFVLCKPTMEVSTVRAYQAIDEAKRLRHADKTAMLHAMMSGDYALMCEKVCNVFEQVIEVPKRPYIKTVMKRCGANATLMSGSGPTVYGIFDAAENAHRACDKLRAEFPETFVAAPVARSIEVTAL